jgi:hypothetical protein
MKLCLDFLDLIDNDKVRIEINNSSYMKLGSGHFLQSARGSAKNVSNKLFFLSFKRCWRPKLNLRKRNEELN